MSNAKLFPYIIIPKDNRSMLEALNLPDTFTLQTFLILPVLIALEAVLSADNAIALAALTRGLRDPKLEQQALNIGLVMAYVLRMGLILVASQVVNQWQFELAGAFYLLWLVYQHFTSEEDEDGEHSEPRFASLWQAIPTIALTDLAFSLDSVTTAIAVSDETWLVLLGGTIGIIALRFMTGLFMQWLGEYERLEDAGYVTVSLVGFRLLLRVFNDSLVPPEWMMITSIAIIFAWGFSKKNEGNLEVAEGAADQGAVIGAASASPAESLAERVTESVAKE